MYMSKNDLDAILQNSAYVHQDLHISENKYHFITSSNVLYLLNFKFNMFKRKWDYYDMAQEVFYRIKAIQQKDRRIKLENLNLSLTYDFILKEIDNESFYVYRGNSAHSLFYNPLEAKYMPLHKNSVENIYNSLFKDFDLDLQRIQQENCPSSKNVLIDQILSLNITVIYTKVRKQQ